MKKKLLLAVLLQFVCTIQILAQSCFNVAAGNDTTIACSQPCLNLMAKVPDVRTTDDYQVVSIPYQPFPFINANGVAFNPAYQDDSCSDVITLPFTFCFYGVNYTQCVVGTNGILTFELSNANTFNAWLLNLGTIANPGPIQPIPYPAGGTQNNPNTAYYPRACIMGPYHDIDPQFTQPQMPRRKMEYIIVGTAPCRKFILNYNEILYFDCPSIVVTQQMVLYEGTGIIDIFIKDKPITCLPTTNEGRAILGIQNWDRDKAVVVNGRNNTIWSATNEGWRFVPNGTTSLLNRVELYRNGLLLSTGTTVALGNGELQATFANICQPQDSMSYTVKAFYKKCDIPAIETEGSDTIIVYRASDPIEAVVTNAPCFNTSSGLITITTPIGPAFEYSISGGTNWQPAPSFAVAPGNYTILSRKINTNCISTISVTVSQPTDFTATATSTNVNCAGNNGSITITATGGTPGYQYSLNNGTTYQNSNQFLNLLPGTYNNILVKDANNCIQMLAKTILFIDTMYLSLNPDTTICAGSGIILKPITNSLTNNFTWTPSVSLSNSSIKNPIASPTDTTQYSLVAQWGNCIRTANITLNVLRKPIVYAGKDTSICANTLATLKGTVSNTSGSVSYNWSPVATLATPLLLTTTAKPGTTQQYILTGKDNYGCNFLVADSVLIAVPPPIIAFAGNDTNAVYGIVHQLSATGGINYLWSPAGSLNNPFLQSPLATLYADTYFTVVVSDATGCKKTDDIFVKVYKGPTYYVPNSFTPNGDNLNDIFRPLAVGINATEYFRIFNRYGQLIYQTNKWMQGWDGTYKGQKAPAGNYVWMIKGKAYTGAVIQMKGSVILLR
jgi:gliding motility-associated-like protein